MSLGRRIAWIPVGILTVFWLLLTNQYDIAQLALGVMLGLCITGLCRPFLINIPRIQRPWVLLGLMGRFLVDIIKANIQVACLVLSPQKRLKPGFVEVPMRIEDEFVLATLACIISLIPGTVSVGLSSDHQRLLLHALDSSQPDQLIAEIKHRYETPLLEVFQCSTR